MDLFSNYVEQIYRADGNTLTKAEKHTLDMLEKLIKSIELNGRIKNVCKLYLEYNAWTNIK